MKTILFLTATIFATSAFAGGYCPPDPKPEPVKINNTNLSNLKQNQKQQLNNHNHIGVKNINNAGDQSATANSKAVTGDQITKVSVNPKIDNKVLTEVTVGPTSNDNRSTAAIHSGAVQNQQTFTHQERIQHSVPTLGVNRVGGVSKAANAFVLTGGYDEMTGNSINAGVVFSFGGGSDIAKSAMKHEEHRMRMDNIYSAERHKQETAKFCVDLQNSGVPVTPDNSVLWEKCGDYLVEPTVVEKVVYRDKVIKVEGHHHKVNSKGILTYDGTKYRAVK